MDPLHATIEEFAADGFTHVECYCPRCRVIRLRPISWLPRISMGLTITQLSERLRCAESGGSSALGYAVADGGRAGQAAGAQRVINRRGALGSVKQHLAIGAVKLVVSCTIDAQASGKICAPVGVEANSICVRHVASLPISPSVGAPQPFSRSPRLSISISSCPQL